MKTLLRNLFPYTLGVVAAASAFILGVAVDDDRDLHVEQVTREATYDDSEPIRARQACDAWDDLQTMIPAVETTEHAQIVNSTMLYLAGQAWATRMWDPIYTYSDVYLNGLGFDVGPTKTRIQTMCGQLRETD